MARVVKVCHKVKNVHPLPKVASACLISCDNHLSETFVVLWCSKVHKELKTRTRLNKH